MARAAIKSSSTSVALLDYGRILIISSTSERFVDKFLLGHE